MLNAPPSPPEIVNSDRQTWEILVHLSPLTAFIFPPGLLLSPFVIWQLKKEEIPSVESHAKAVLNFQLSLLIYLIATVGAIILALGTGIALTAGIYVLAFLPLLAWLAGGIASLFAVFGLIMVAIAALEIRKGRAWSYPFSLRLIR